MEGQLDLLAHARRTDPDTSHAAARAISVKLTEIQRQVEAYAFGKGPAGFCDAEMAHDLDDFTSTLRTRRSELAQRRIILDSGERRKFGKSPHKRIVWLHRSHHPSPPELVEPSAPQPAIGKDEVAAVVLEVQRLAQRYGATYDGQIAARAAAMLQRLSRKLFSS